MEFVDKECPECGKKLGNRKPKDMTEVEPYTTIKRSVSVIAPCPFCGEKIPVWGEPEPAPEPAPEPGPSPAEPDVTPPEE